MAAAGFTLVLEDAPVHAAMHQVVAMGHDLSPMLADMGAELEASTTRRIRETNVGPDGVPWAASLRAQLGNGKTLFETGEHLENSIRFELDGTHAVDVGSNWEGAALHQAGGVIEAKSGFLSFHLADGGYARVKSVTMPARPYLGVSLQDHDALLAIAGEHVARALSSAAGTYQGAAQ